MEVHWPRSLTCVPGIRVDILLIEDNNLIGDAIVGHMADGGDSVRWCQNAVDGMAAAGQGTYDCVVLDLRLPDGDGLSVLEHIRKLDRNVPVLILSAFDQLSDRMEGLASGADDYLIKPFSLPDLGIRISRLVGEGRQQ